MGHTQPNSNKFVNSELLPVFAPACVNTTIISLNKPLIIISYLKRLKSLGANKDELLDIYYKQVRSVLELAVPVWQPGLTQQEIRQIYKYRSAHSESY